MYVPVFMADLINAVNSSLLSCALAGSYVAPSNYYSNTF